MPETTLDARVTALEERLGRLEGMIDVLTAIRADVAAIAEGVDPTLGRHVAELESTVENHGLLLARLLEKDAGP
jgi:hypothetical protein